MDDGQRRSIRQVLSGQDDEPVELQTDPGGGETGWAEHDHPPMPADVLSVSHAELADELQRHDPMLFELLASRVVIRRLSS